MAHCEPKASASQQSPPRQQGNRAMDVAKDSQKSLVIAQRLPVEILIAVFEMIILPPRLTRVHLSRHRNADAETWISLPYICSQWYPIALSVLYASIEIRTYKQTLSLLRALQTYPHLRKLIKGLHLPMRVGVPCPLEVYRLFCQIIHLVDDLRELSATGVCGQPVFQYPGTFIQTDDKAAWTKSSLSLPIAPDRHQDLVYLELRGELTTLSVSLPPQLFSFQGLKQLTLANIALTERLNPGVTPKLPLLEAITFTNRNPILLLDDWLCAHPKLHTLRMYEARGPTIIPRLISSGKIKRMEMMHCVTYQWNRELISSWFNACTSLRELRVSDDIFLQNSDLVPINLEELRVEIARHWLDMTRWERYFERGPNLGRFILSAHPRRNWYKELGESVISYAKEHTPVVVFEPPNCNCSDNVRKSRSARFRTIPGNTIQDAIGSWNRAPECESE
ncbi:SubName: Full=Uncharacterized protein {ECO:0000313/EMBL:CCA72358.1} [Serendipita indica DSM 11827]|nr:SubName: Full=Uncharacterized protein {ECO:0000313/EMBL:CCA72358.1} [Serendipita indica DSM 11827]